MTEERREYLRKYEKRRLKWERQRMPWPPEYFEVQPISVSTIEEPQRPSRGKRIEPYAPSA